MGTALKNLRRTRRSWKIALQRRQGAGKISRKDYVNQPSVAPTPEGLRWVTRQRPRKNQARRQASRRSLFTLRTRVTTADTGSRPLAPSASNDAKDAKVS